MAKTNVLRFSDGHTVPVIGLGTFESKPGEVTAAVEVAISCGYRHIDCALLYGNEAEVGEGIRRKMADGTVKREELFVTSKLWCTYMSPARVEEGCMKSLEALGLQYLDLYLIHWPLALKESDEMFPKDENGKLQASEFNFVDAWKAMQPLVDKGLVKSLGVSNFNSKQVQKLLSLENLKHKPVCNQIEISPNLQNEKLIQFCKDRGLVVVAYGPLGSPNRPWAKTTDPKATEDDVLKTIGKKYNKSTSQIILRWGLQRGYVILPKSVTPSRIKENLQVFDFQLTDDEMQAIYKLDKNFRAFAVQAFADHPDYPFNEEF